MSTVDTAPGGLAPGTDESLTSLLALRRTLLDGVDAAPSPAVARALEMADIYLFLAISYLGYTDELFPEERRS